MEVMFSIEWRQSDVDATTVDRVASGIVQAVHPVINRIDDLHDRKAPPVSGDKCRVWIKADAGNLPEAVRTANVIQHALDILTESASCGVDEFAKFMADRAAARKARQS